MKITRNIQNAFREIGHSIRRFPLTVLFLVACTFINARMIEGVSDEYTQLLFTGLIGALTSAVGQMVYERFYSSKNIRYAIMGISMALTSVYYLILNRQEEIEQSLYIRTAVVLLALFITFIWIPTLKNERIAFHQSFLSAFKAFVITILFTSVLALGVVLITQAINFLLFRLDGDLLFHLLNIIASFFAPVYFLSMTPDFMDKEEEENITNVSVVLERMLSFILIPLLSIYTLILILYLIINIRQDFWMDNLLEPLLVSYTLMGIIIVLLASNLTNQMSEVFLKIFPKIFLPIVIFQTISSVLKIGEMGITHGRYYVILFGLFAIAAGVIFSFNRPKTFGWIAVILITLATISSIPPVDAFSISKRNQVHLLEEKLNEVGLLQNNQLVSNKEVSLEDRRIITEVVTYLADMGYAKDIEYLPKDFEVYNEFGETFGFEMTFPGDASYEDYGRFAYSENEFDIVYDLQGEDMFTRQSVSIYYDGEKEVLEDVSFTADQEYTISRDVVANELIVEVIDANNQSVITVNTTEIFEQMFAGTEDGSHTVYQNNIEDTTFIEENERVRMKFVVVAVEDTPDYYSADYYMFVDIK